MRDSVKIVVVGDSSIAPETLEEAALKLDIPGEKTIKKLWWGSQVRSEMQKQLLNVEVNGPEAEPYARGLDEEIKDADYLLSHLGTIPKEIIRKAERLKLIGVCRGGIEMIDTAAATEKGIPVIHVIRNAEATSDFAVGLMFAETRNIARSHASIQKGSWRKEYVNSGYTTSMREMTVGIVGLGHIGKLVAQKVMGIGMKVIGYDPYVSEEALRDSGLEGLKKTGLEELFAQADIVSLHMRVTPETEGMIGRDLLMKMKPTAYLINTSRAKVLNREDFIDVMEKRQIGGAALDVFWDEPLKDDDPLLKLDNITMTSHLAGNVVDALPKSPFLLAKTINQYLETGTSDMLVNKIQTE
ncbi:2-hydroxyacid dehydrogenase [Clostridium sp. Marseille-P3244]|uniref:2-hydroxyacid dehydrogenase n=1 Tax=Clostridium sp. Marseille-P3244 TaxID=1871020 RepID=UPI000930B2DD|nr:2-hydroxyacid dehydrogenase [Clostridium sp. Marseille-P3244]